MFTFSHQKGGVHGVVGACIPTIFPLKSLLTLLSSVIRRRKWRRFKRRCAKMDVNCLPPIQTPPPTKMVVTETKIMIMEWGSWNEGHGLEWRKGVDENSFQFSESNMDTKSQSSFLQLIRPMIMDQVNVAVQTYMNSQIRGIVEQSMASQLTLV